MKRQASKQQSGQQQASPPQRTQPEPAGSQPVVEQQEFVPNDEPLLNPIFPLPGGFSLPTAWGLQLHWLGSTLHRAQLLRVWGLLCLLRPRPVLTCLILHLYWLARKGALSLCQMLSPLGRQRLHLLIVWLWCP